MYDFSQLCTTISSICFLLFSFFPHWNTVHLDWMILGTSMGSWYYCNSSCSSWLCNNCQQNPLVHLCSFVSLPRHAYARYTRKLSFSACAGAFFQINYICPIIAISLSPLGHPTSATCILLKSQQSWEFFFFVIFGYKRPSHHLIFSRLYCIRFMNIISTDVNISRINFSLSSSNILLNNLHMLFSRMSYLNCNR